VLKYISPSIRIHGWGGLGSQLYAWALLEDLESTYRYRKFSLVLHDSGLTQRSSDLNFLKTNLKVRERFDFNPNTHESTSDTKRSSSTFSLKNLFKFFLVKFSFLVYVTNNSDFKKIRFWTFSIRGHYSRRLISSKTVELMKTRALSCGQQWFITEKSSDEDAKYLSTQIRLGDLLQLKLKRPIEFDLIFKQIREITSASQFITHLRVASDSLDLAIKEIESRSYGDLVIDRVSENPWNTIVNLTRANTFLGTNSKISVWVSILLLLGARDQVKVVLPSGAMNHLKFNLENHPSLSFVTEY
jgi:hypothetical protein